MLNRKVIANLHATSHIQDRCVYIPTSLKTEIEFYRIKSSLIKQKKIILSFDYYTWKRGNQEIANFEVEMEKFHFEKRYLILHVYDFREENIEKKYGCLTDEDYITDFNYPQGGILISCG